MPQKLLDELASDEVLRRMGEAEEYYFDFAKADEPALEDDLREAIGSELSARLGAVETASLADEMAKAALQALHTATNNLRRRALESGLARAVYGVISGRLERMRRYLALVTAQRPVWECRLPVRAVQVLQERFDAVQDWATVHEVDYDRLGAILVPEACRASYRRHAEDLLSLWGRLCREVLPEAYAEPEAYAVPTAHLPGTWEKVDVMAVRETLGADICSPDDAQVDEADGVVAPQGSNGKKDARLIAGVAAEKLVMRMQGCEVEGELTPEAEWGADWWRLGAAKRWHRLDVAAEADLGRLDRALKAFGWEARATRGGQPDPELEQHLSERQLAERRRCEGEGVTEVHLNAAEAAELQSLFELFDVAASVTPVVGGVLDATNEARAEPAAEPVAPVPVPPPALVVEMPAVPAGPRVTAKSGKRSRRAAPPEEEGWLPFTDVLK